VEQRARHWWLVALTVLVALVAAACGDDGDDQAQTDQTSTTVEEGSSTSAPAVTVDGCGEDAYTDQADRSSSRPIARCEPGAPAPQPLSERITIKLAAATKGEYLAPVLLGIARGEFEKENLEIELIQLPFADAVAQMGQGGIDAAHGGDWSAVADERDPARNLEDFAGLGHRVRIYYSADDGLVPSSTLTAFAEAIGATAGPIGAVGHDAEVAYPAFPDGDFVAWAWARWRAAD